MTVNVRARFADIAANVEAAPLEVMSYNEFSSYLTRGGGIKQAFFQPTDDGDLLLNGPDSDLEVCSGHWYFSQDCKIHQLGLRDLTLENLFISWRLCTASLRDCKVYGSFRINSEVQELRMRDSSFSELRVTGALRLVETTNVKVAGIKLLDGFGAVRQLSGIGSRDDTLTIFLTIKGPRYSTGCRQFISEAEFKAKVAKTHDTKSRHYRDYMAAIGYANRIWKSMKGTF